MISIFGQHEGELHATLNKVATLLSRVQHSLSSIGAKQQLIIRNQEKLFTMANLTQSEIDAQTAAITAAVTGFQTFIADVQKDTVAIQAELTALSGGGALPDTALSGLTAAVTALTTTVSSIAPVQAALDKVATAPTASPTAPAAPSA